LSPWESRCAIAGQCKRKNTNFRVCSNDAAHDGISSKTPSRAELLSNGSNGRNSRGGNILGSVDVHLLVHLSTGGLLRAIPGDMPSLSALVAGLAGCVEWASVGSGAVAGDVAELAASVALHGLGLTVSSEVVGATALIAGGGTGTASVPTTSIAICASADGASATHANTSRVGASSLSCVRVCHET
jgi:hypothetical protein